MPIQSPYCETVLIGRAITERHGEARLRAMLPLSANDIAFMNSVVLGTNAKSVTPRNFSAMPKSSSITSTTSTRSSKTGE